ncbi:MAG: NAD(+)/NADH kinase [Candidatus Marinimicrobia bacterium]|nr:NAD(+)/NADH kinase [Candidatus Neomarinimicrobiota bacterium]MDD5583089.1 NAD(+)/NADH kinase [Candidatus Neomarinimicrobiota bacterium]
MMKTPPLLNKISNFGILANERKLRSIRPILVEFCDYLSKKGADFVLDETLIQKIPELAQYKHLSLETLLEYSHAIITLGGDGTILNAAHIIGTREIPILGFHMGELGFLAELSRYDYQEKMDDILQGNLLIDDRMLLKSEGHNGKRCTSEFALNDIVLFKGLSPRMMTIKVDIDGDFMNNYLCDGLIISTPTGSTAYSLSCNGPILTPDVPAIIINPICPHTLSQRPLVIDASRTIRITFEEVPQGAYLTADGQHVERLNKKGEIFIRKADHKVRLIRCLDYSYFKVLRQKLNWGKR